MAEVVYFGQERPSNNFISIAFNQVTNNYSIIWNSRFRTPLNKTYRIIRDYDFGSQTLEDLLIDSYESGNTANGLILVV